MFHQTIITNCARVVSAALLCHHGAALAPEQLGEIVDIRLVVGRCLAVNRTSVLHRPKAIQVDDRRDGVRDDRIFIAVFAQIPAVLEQSVETVLGERIAPAVADAASVQRPDNAAEAFPRCVPLERSLHHRCGGRVALVVLLAVDAVSQRHLPTVELSFEGVLLVAAAGLLGQLYQIVLDHAFQQAFLHDTLRHVGDGLGYRYHMDSIAFEAALIMERVIPAAGKVA